MADTDILDVAALCESAVDTNTLGLCALNSGLESTNSGLNVFFLLFGVCISFDIFLTMTTGSSRYAASG